MWNKGVIGNMRVVIVDERLTDPRAAGYKWVGTSPGYTEAANSGKNINL